ncbi:MAG TPA: sulfotransferase, partial [Gammaproteobacteria bacterium]|nr:sulfotransferase [Gammaproteobacteria bacterium]
PIGGWLFPKNRQYYDKYLDFSVASDVEKSAWKESFHWFNKKISYRYPGQQLLLKSPPHTARIPLILELYPNAKFIHIQRHPFEVYRSFFYFYQKLVTMINLQRLSVEEVEETIISRYQLIYNSYFAHRSMIPKGNLVEIYYEDLEMDPLEQLEHIYCSLQLSDFIKSKPKISNYLETVKTYKKNSSSSLPPDLRDKLYTRWRLSFDNWRYEA